MNKNIRPSSRDFIESILVLLLLLALMLALYDVLSVFFGVLTFALIFSISFERPFERLVRFLKNRRKLAGFIYSIILTGIIAVPLVYIFSSFIRRVKDAINLVSEIKEKGLPPSLRGFHIFLLLVISFHLFGHSCN